MSLPPDSNMRYIPGGWPRAATPCDLVPRWAGEFSSFNDWVSKATTRLSGAKGSMGHVVPAICVDAKGRRCSIGADFHRAREEDAFPVRYFWEMQPACEWVEELEIVPGQIFADLLEKNGLIAKAEGDAV